MNANHTRQSRAHARFMRRLLRPTRSWVVSFDGPTVVLELRRATPVVRVRGLDAATREHLSPARNDSEVYAALPPDARTALLNEIRRLIDEGGGLYGVRRQLRRR